MWYYTLIKDGCPDGYAYVRDYMGNKCYYGTVDDCKAFIERMEGELYQ